MPDIGVLIYRKLGPVDAATSEYLLKFEGSDTLVDTERARDVAWTEEIIRATTGFVLVLDGEILLSGLKSIDAAESARKRARVVTSIELDDAPAEKPDRRTKPAFVQV